MSAKWIAILIIVIVAAGGIYWLMSGKPAPNPITSYPTSQSLAVQQFFTDISTNSTDDDQKAFTLISWPIRQQDPSNQDEYVWHFGSLNDYLTGLFGDSWIQQLQIQVPSDPNATTCIAQINTETFHINLAGQKQYSPPGTFVPSEEHWGIVSIDEFPFTGGAQAQRATETIGVMNTMGLNGAASNLGSIVAANSGADNGPSWAIKERLLPEVEDPNGAAIRQCIYQLWPVRKDPTVIYELNKVIDDPRYSQDAQQAAKDVLSGHVDEAILVGNGVTNTN
ncbi:MAG TPA: hypothetical protein VMG59_02665 [Phycisphaerae bacterium]|nr:hypothetical protein [Phycisphaerae bacterium]